MENLHELASERKALRSALNEAGATPAIAETAKKGIEEIGEKLSGWSIEKEGGLKKAKERLISDRAEAEREAKKGVDEKAIEAEMGESAPVFEEIKSLSEKLDDIRNFEMQRSLEKKSDPHAKKAHESLLQTARKERETIEKKLAELSEKNPKESRAFELIKYKEGLAMEGHIAVTPSVQENLKKIGRNMQIGKPMFLHGPTGTGKTSLARLAAGHFTWTAAEIVYCNPQTRESSVWGKTGIRPAKGESGKYGGIETVDIFGPLAKAMSEGKSVIFDEFSALPKEQMVFIKGVFNAKPGDTVNIVGNGRIKITPGFQMIFTANLKSEKNPERQELPPEIAREFEQNNIKIDYAPKEEAYDIMLSRLMNPDGSVDASWMTLNETMPKLCEAMEEIQIAYTGSTRAETARLTGSMDAAGKAPGLKKFVMTQGTIEAILDDWKVEKEQGGKVSFAEHIDRRLKIGLTFEEYPLADRLLAAKILASKGFLRTVTSQELGLPADVFSFDAAKRFRKEGGEREKALTELRKESGNEKHLSLKELSGLDPFGVRKTKVLADAERLALEAEEKLRRERGGRGAEAGETSVKDAEHMMQGKFIGAEKIEKAFGFVPESIPPVPFTPETIELHEKLGHYLVYETKTTPEGNPLTIEEMAKIAGSNVIETNPDSSPKAYRLHKEQFGHNGESLSSAWFSDRAKYQAIFSETPDGGWKFVSPEIIDGSTNRNYVDQTDFLINYWKEHIFENDDSKIPQEYADAFKKWDDNKASIQDLMKQSKWIEACDVLSKHPVSKLIRESFASTVYRLIVIEKTENKKILSDKYSWSKTPSSDGDLLAFGYFASVGAFLRVIRPDSDWAYIGSVFSRMNPES